MATQQGNAIDIQTESGFKTLYKSYYSKLMRFARYYTLCEADAENIVQDVFVLLWEKKEATENKVLLASYLFTMVKNRCLDYLKHKSIVEEYKLYIEENHYYEVRFKIGSLQGMDSEALDDEAIRTLLTHALETLPPRCREIFIKGKLEGMKYKEIAKEMEISEKTVENQMQIAMKKLSVTLKENPLLLLFLFC